MFKKKNNIFILALSIVLSIIGGIIVYYWKQQELERLEIKVNKLEEKNKQLEKKITQYSSTLSTI